MCQGVGDSEEICEYTCLICQRITKTEDIVEFIHKKRETFDIDFNSLANKKQDILKELNAKKKEESKLSGPFKKNLIKALDEIKVDRQSYHVAFLWEIIVK